MQPVIDKELRVPGLEDHSIEFFWSKDEETLKAIYDGQVIGFNNLSKSIKAKLYELMLEDKLAMEKFRVAGVTRKEDQLWVYFKCGFGALNVKPDYCPEEDALSPEAWSCPCNGHCCLKDHFNKKHKVSYGELSQREVEVIKSLYTFEKGSAVALILGITEDTLNKHKASIFQKVGVQTLPQLVVWAYQNQVI